MHRVLFKVCLVAILSSLLWIAGCGEDGPEQSLTCGENTNLVDGQCVVVDHDCDDLEVVAPSGECVDPNQFCDDQAAVYDAGSGECVVDPEVTCGEGTVEQDGVCVVDDDVTQGCGPGTVLVDGVCELSEDVCGEGARFDENQCELAEEACGEDAQFDLDTEQCVFVRDVDCGDSTRAEDGYCIPDHTDADDLAAQADFDYTDDETIVADDEESVIFTGQMVDAVSHTFEFEAEEGQWVDISIYSRGLPAPGFTLEAEDGFDFERTVVPGLQSAPSRIIPIPRDDTYELTVTTAVGDPDHSEDSWLYVGEVEVIDTPDPVDWNHDMELWSGDLADTEANFVSIDVDDVDDLFLEVQSQGPDIHGIQVTRWASSSSSDTNDSLEGGVRSELNINTDDILLHFDAVKFTGMKTDFEVASLQSDTLKSDAFHFHYLDAQAGDTLEIRHQNDQDAELGVRVFREGQYPVGQYDDVYPYNASSYSTDDSDTLYVPVDEDGEYMIEFRNTTGDTVTGVMSVSSVGDAPWFSVGAGETVDIYADLGGHDLNQGQWKVVVLDLENPTTFEGTISHDGSSWAPTVTLFDMDGQVVASQSGSSSSSTGFAMSTLEAGRYLMAFQPRSSWTSIGGLELDMVAHSADAVDVGETLTFTFQADGFDILSGGLSHTGGPSPELRWYNPDGVLILEETDAGDLDLMEIVPGPGEYTIEVENTGDSPVVGLEVGLDVSTPYDFIDIDSDYSNSYSMGLMEPGDKELMLFMPETDFRYSFSAIFSQGEMGVARLWDLSERELLLEVDGDQRVDLENEPIGPGMYVIEFQAQSYINPYDITFLANEIKVVEETREHDPVLEVAPGMSIESSAMAIDGCASILDVSLSLDFASTPTNSDLAIYLYAPGLSQPIAVRDQSSGSHSTTYPDDSTPDESMGPLLGTTGDGIWSLDIVNHSYSSSAELEEWKLELTCVASTQ